MKLLSVNVGQPREVQWQGKPLLTGIFKEPVAGRVALRGHNLAGDRQADPKVHGGPHMALYAYPSEHYPDWCAWLGEDALPWGAFGENLTTEGLLETGACIGDRYRVGSAVLEVSQPRIPCHKLGIRHGRADLPKHFHQSGRTGFYLRVVEEGELGAGDAIEVVSRDAEELAVAEVQGLLRGEDDPDVLRRAAAHAALGIDWSEELRRRLAAAQQPAAD